MKILLFAISVLFSASTFAADTRSFEFEVDSIGCMWSKSEGKCVVTNRYNAPIKCVVTTTGSTSRGSKIRNTKMVTVPANRFDDGGRVSVNGGGDDALTNVSAVANCRAE